MGSAVAEDTPQRPLKEVPLPRRVELKVVLSVTLYARSGHMAIYEHAKDTKGYSQSRPRILVPIPYLPETWGELYDLMERFWNTNRDKIAREEKA